MLRVNINSIVLGKRYSKTKNAVRGMRWFYILPLSLMDCLVENSWIFITAFYSQSVVICFVWSIEENPAIHSISVSSSCSCEYSLMFQNPASSGFLGVSRNVESETLLMNSLYSNVNVYWSILHFGWIFHLCVIL